jgi:hypothetical protein
MPRIDYYRLLGVDPRASPSEIRAAYRGLARRLHPDADPGGGDVQAANRRMAALNEAYAVLNDPAQRAQYDLLRERWTAHQRRARRQMATRQRAGPDDQPRAPRRIVFRASPDVQVRRAFVSMVLLAVGVFGAYLALTREPILGAAVTGVGLIGAGVSGVTALPAFEGHVQLTQDALVVYPTLGLRGPRVYRLDEICEVHWLPRWGRRDAAGRILIDYYRRDPKGQVDVQRYRSTWLLSVDDSPALYCALRDRASARKHAHTHPTWAAVLVGARDAIAVAVALICVAAGAILWATVRG